MRKSFRATRSLHLAIIALSFSALLGGESKVLAHHTYAMFDGEHTKVISGTVAKLEWKNPHVFVWVYVPNQNTPGGYDLWAFENGSPSVLGAIGWSLKALKMGEPITVEYWPLKNGDKGGHFEKATLSGGRSLRGAGGPGRF